LNSQRETILACDWESTGEKVILTHKSQAMQKTIITLIFGVLCSSQIFSQTTAEAIVFSENGDLFTAYLNGRQINEEPFDRVEIPNLSADYYKLKLDFEKPTMNDFSGGMMVEMGVSTTYMAKQNRKGKIVIRPVSTAPIAQQMEETPAKPQRPARPVEPVAPSQPTAPSQEVRTTTTTTTRGGKDGIKMDVDVDGTKVSVDMRVPDMEMEVEESTTVTTTTTRTTTSEEEVVYEEEEVVIDEGGCGMPMSSSDFASAKSSIEAKSFSDSQLTLAKQIAKSNCLKAEQVKAIVEIFDFEDTKLDFAMFAYDYTVDQNNYYKVNDAFDFESSIEELDEFLMSK
jgi:hypothetical protein